MVYPIADKLKIPRNRVFANNFIFDEVGTYYGFDPTELTSKEGGKRAVIQMLKDIHDYSSVVMIGDGATDLNARPAADALIGYGGVAIRKPVQEKADWFVTDFKVRLSWLSLSHMIAYQHLYPGGHWSIRLNAGENISQNINEVRKR
jgi:phosphoserine phosphatase